MKNKLAMLTIIITLTTSITAFASPANRGIPARDGSGIYSNTQRGYNRFGNPKGLGLGGIKLQDGSCYIVK